MATRLELSEKLREFNIPTYYQPPETFKMTYPCIVYDLENDQVQHADDGIYHRKKRYTVTVIDRNPDSDLPDRLSDAFGVRMERHYTTDNLHHFSYTIIT